MPLPQHTPEFDALAAHIQSVGLFPVVFVPSPGNWGDSLINAGSREFLRSYSLDYIEVRREAVLNLEGTSELHVIVGGGGGWCKYWHSTPEFIMELLPKAGHLTVLPTTIADAPSSPDPAENMTLFSRGLTGMERDDYPLKYCHDMAFHCSDAAGYKASVNGDMLAFRQDKESLKGTQPAENFDLSLLGDGFTDPRGFYHALSRNARIQTDRLHIGIAAAQLGLDVQLYPSAYPKLQGVYTKSISGVFENVTARF